MVLFVLGICQGMQPIAGYNYGAGHQHRLREVYFLTLKICVCIGFVASAICLLFPEQLMQIFTTDRELINIGKNAIRYVLVLSPLIAFTITNSNFFMSIDKPAIAIITSLSRQVLFLTPLSFLFPIVMLKLGLDGLNGVWLANTGSDIAGAMLAAFLLYRQRHVFGKWK